MYAGCPIEMIAKMSITTLTFTAKFYTHIYSIWIHILTISCCLILKVKFSRKLLGKGARRHINIKSITLNVQSVRQLCLRCLQSQKFWTALATGFLGRSFQIISSVVRRAVQNFISDCKHAWARLADTWTFHVIDFMLMCLRTHFASSFLENFTWCALGWKFYLRNLSLWLIKMLSYSVYFEIQQPKMVNMCIRVVCVRVCKIWL